MDEVWFYVFGYVNVQTFRVWSIKNWCELCKKKWHLLKISVWCGILALFWNDYGNILLKYEFHLITWDKWVFLFFQQDDTLTHCSMNTVGFLQNFRQLRNFFCVMMIIIILRFTVQIYLHRTFMKLPEEFNLLNQSCH